MTWTQNGNLLGDWIAADGAQAVFAAISAVSPSLTLPILAVGGQPGTPT